jgi:CheY-like chemotaxis protein
MVALLEILVIESNLADARLIVELFKGNKLHNNLRILNSARQTIAYLRREGEFDQALQPDIIFINVVMTVRESFDLWHEILMDEVFSLIPVILVSSSEGDQNLLKRHNGDIKLEPACYIYKPIGMSELLKAIKHIDGYGISLTKTDIVSS